MSQSDLKLAKKQRRFATVSPYAVVNPTRRNRQKRGLRILDGNAPEAHFLRRVQKDLVEHVGGSPTAPQRAIIAKIAWAELRCLLLDKKLIESRETPYDHDTYLAHANSLSRWYKLLGIKQPEPKFSQLMKKKDAA